MEKETIFMEKSTGKTSYYPFEMLGSYLGSFLYVFPLILTFFGILKSSSNFGWFIPKAFSFLYFPVLFIYMQILFFLNSFLGEGAGFVFWPLLFSGFGLAAIFGFIFGWAIHSFFRFIKTRI
jgi:hypothetical protein